MGKEPDQIRAEIEETRDRMGETVGAIGYKADVPGRARESVANTKERVVSSVRDVKDRAVDSIVGTKDSVASSAGSIGDATPSAEDIRRGARKTVGVAQENPIGLAVGAIAVGFLAGLAVPSTKVEDENLGPIADQVKEKARETGQEAMERGKHVAQSAAQAAKDVAEQTKDTVQEAAQSQASSLKDMVKKQGEGLASSAKEGATEVASSAPAGGGSGGVGVSSAETASGPEIKASDLIEGNTGIAGTGITTSEPSKGRPASDL